MHDLHQTGERLLDGLSIALHEMRPEPELAISKFGEVGLAKLAKRFRHVVDDEPVVLGEQARRHLRYLPPGEIEVKPIKKRECAQVLWQWLEEVTRLDHDLDRAIRISK